jgi:hypothetical protein
VFYGNHKQSKKHFVESQNRMGSNIGEKRPHSKVLVSYLIPLALIPAIAGFIGFGLFRFNLMGLHSSFIGLGIRHAVTSLVSTLGELTYRPGSSLTLPINLVLRTISTGHSHW